MAEHSKKTAAKRVGIKSVIAHDGGKLAVTTFGKKSAAKLAYRDGDQTPFDEEKKSELGGFNITGVGDAVDAERGIPGEGLVEASVANPVNDLIDESRKEYGQDYLMLKDQLEKVFFGQTFPSDNLRIQIIYNILDMQKAFGLYVNDVLYAVNNLQNTGRLLTDDDWTSDVIGLALGKGRGKEIIESMSDALGFFGSAFKPIPKKPGDKTSGKYAGGKLKERDAAIAEDVAVLRVLCGLRQISAHFRSEKKGESLWASDLGVEKYFKNEMSVVDANYKARAKKIDDNFMATSRANLVLLFRILNAETKEEKEKIAVDYYKFAIRKEGKNLGVNLKKARERLLDKRYPDAKNKQFDSYRGKLYTLTDFIIYRMATEDGAFLEESVQKLRSTPSEEEKEKVYDVLAETIWNATKDDVKKVFDIRQQDIKNAAAQSLDGVNLGSVTVEKEKEFPVVKLLAFLCNFLDGKEINELLSTFVNRLENVQALIDLAKNLGEKVNFSKNYAVFNDCGSGAAGRIAERLRLLASIGKMDAGLDSLKPLFIRFAIQILGGARISDEDVDAYIKENILVRKDDPEKKRSNTFRNFITNNVIKSRRFVYLVRYTKADAVRAVMKNGKIVRYVLARIPETQVDSYYKSVVDSSDAGNGKPIKEKIKALAEKLGEFSFDLIAENRDGIIDNAKLDEEKKNVEIERLKAVTGLYLTVAFIAIKNLVKANARYYIAYSAFERDSELLKEKLGEEEFYKLCIEFKNKKGETGYNNAFALLKYYIDRDEDIWRKEEASHRGRDENGKLDYDPDPRRKHYPKRRWLNILKDNLAEMERIDPTGMLAAQMRNDAMHLNAMFKIAKFVGEFRKGSSHEMRSYFELFHFLEQKTLLDSKEDFVQGMRESYGGRIRVEPCVDLIKYLYITLGYSLPRYKTMTVSGLFDPDSEDAKERAKGKRV